MVATGVVNGWRGDNDDFVNDRVPVTKFFNLRALLCAEYIRLGGMNEDR